jgi:hypothetical protein
MAYFKVGLQFVFSRERTEETNHTKSESGKAWAGEYNECGTDDNDDDV